MAYAHNEYLSEAEQIRLFGFNLDDLNYRKAKE